MSLSPNPTVFRFLFSTTSHFVGSLKKDDFSLELAFPSMARSQQNGWEYSGPYARSNLILSVQIEEQVKQSIVVPQYEWIGDEASALLGGWFGKLIKNLGHFQAGNRFTVPATPDERCAAYAKPPFNNNARKPIGSELNLDQASPALEAYFFSGNETQMPLILRACEFYRMALENYTSRPEMAYTLLTSTLECLLDLKSYSDEELYDAELLQELEALRIKCPEAAKLAKNLKRRLFQVKRKVTALIDHLIPDTYFTETETGTDWARIKNRAELLERAKGAYDIRSKILHTGDRSFIFYLAHDHENSEIQVGTPVLKDQALVRLLMNSVNLTGLERITSTALRSSISRYLVKPTPHSPVT